MISFVTPEGLFLCNEFPQEGLALKPSDFMKFRYKENIAGLICVGYKFFCPDFM